MESHSGDAAKCALVRVVTEHVRPLPNGVGVGIATAGPEVLRHLVPQRPINPLSRLIHRALFIPSDEIGTR